MLQPPQVERFCLTQFVKNHKFLSSIPETVVYPNNGFFSFEGNCCSYIQ
jgi:hypothetical protein